MKRIMCAYVIRKKAYTHKHYKHIGRLRWALFAETLPQSTSCRLGQYSHNPSLLFSIQWINEYILKGRQRQWWFSRVSILPFLFNLCQKLDCKKLCHAPGRLQKHPRDGCVGIFLVGKQFRKVLIHNYFYDKKFWYIIISMTTYRFQI